MVSLLNAHIVGQEGVLSHNERGDDEYRTNTRVVISSNT